MPYSPPAGNAIDFDLVDSYSPPAGNAINFDLVEDEAAVLTSFFDGKIRIKDKTTNLFDGKIRIKDTTFHLFDGKVYIGHFSTNPFDGKIRIKDTTFHLFDGKLRIIKVLTDLFDGKLRIIKVLTDLFDGKVFISRQPHVWYSGGDLIAGRESLAGCGTQSAALSFGGVGGFAKTEEYNGVSWSSGGDLITGREKLAGCGVQTAAVSFGGFSYHVETEEYNGTSWSSGGNLIIGRHSLAGCGTQTAGLSFGGEGGLSKTEEYNGTSWSSGGNLITGRYALAGCGAQTAALSFGGEGGLSKTEEYNGTSWSVSGDLITGRERLAGCGTQDAALSFGGYGNCISLATTEEYNSTSWSSGGDLITARYFLAGAGSRNDGLSFGGVGGLVKTEEYNAAPIGTPTDLFDGRLALGFFPTDLFDGKIRIKDTTTVAFDGHSLLSWGQPQIWVASGDLPWAVTLHAGCGTQAAALSFGGGGAAWSTYEYNGASWSGGGDLILGRSELAGTGFQSAGLSIGGYDNVMSSCYRDTEEYNGTSWSSASDMNSSACHAAAAGSQIAALCFGGYHVISMVKVPIATTEEYNGTSWSFGGSLSARYGLAGCGTQAAALSFGGFNSGVKSITQEYNGTSWASGGNLSLARYQLAGCGLQGAALSFGGTNSAEDTYYTKTEKYDGTSWSDGGNLLLARCALGGCGYGVFGLSFGGWGSSAHKNTEEYSPLESTDLFDGKVRVKGTTFDLFDGKLILSSEVVNLFDGKVHIGYFLTSSFDGKIRLGYRQRESYLGGFGEPYKIDLRNAFGSSSSLHSIIYALVVTETRSILLGLGETIEYLLYIPLAQTECQQVVNHLSDSINAIQALINDITSGDPFSGRLPLLTSIQSELGIQLLVNELSGILAGAQKLLTALTESVSSHVSLTTELALQNDIQSLLVLLGSLPDPATLYPDCTLNIYLDGVPINSQIADLSFVMDREVTFDVLSFSSTDVRLYAKLQEIAGSKDSTLEVQYKGTSWLFLIEEVSGYELSYSVWGRSIAAAKSDAPFEDNVNFVLETDTLASIVAEDLVPKLSVTWNVVDWVVLADWSVDGTPVQKLKMLADSVGAVVRSYPDGTGFYVDEKYTTRPVDLLYAASVEDYDRDVDLMSLDTSRDFGTGANSVTVRGHSPFSKYSIRLEADSCVDVGNPATIKVYPALEGVGYMLVASDGVPAYQHSLSEEHIETVSFVGGKGSVNYPIMSLKSITWDGVVPAGFEYAAGQDEIVLTDDTLAAVGEVVYTTRYDVWHGAHSGEGQLLVVCYLDEGGGIVAKVYFGEGDHAADDIDRPILTSIEAAVAAGQAFLDDTSYNRLLRAIVVPCSNVSDGDVVSVLSDLSGVTGNVFVLKHEISVRVDNEALKITSNLNVVQFEV